MTEAQKQLSTTGAKADLPCYCDSRMEEKHKLCLMTSFLKASAKSEAGRDAALKKQQECAAAAMEGLRASSRMEWGSRTLAKTS